MLTGALCGGKFASQSPRCFARIPGGIALDAAEATLFQMSSPP
jgi:hypothetical protein